MDQSRQLIIDRLQIDFPLLKVGKTIEEFKIQLADAVEEMLRSDFPRLIQILYRLDVNEEQLKEQLKGNQHTPAAEIIAEMIIQRQLQKLETKKKFGGQENISEEEKW